MPVPRDFLQQILRDFNKALCGTGILPVELTGWKPVPHILLLTLKLSLQRVPAGKPGALNTGHAYMLTCTTWAGGNPLKYVEDAWL